MASNEKLGTEKIGKLLFRFSLPCVISLLISSLYNLVDQIFVGNSSLGYLGNAATGVVYPIIVVTQAFAWGFGDGCAAFLAICQGKKETEKASKAMGTGISLTLISSLFIILFSLLFSDPIFDILRGKRSHFAYGSFLFMDSGFLLPFQYVTEHAQQHHSKRWLTKFCDDYNRCWSNFKHHS